MPRCGKHFTLFLGIAVLLESGSALGVPTSNGAELPPPTKSTTTSLKPRTTYFAPGIRVGFGAEGLDLGLRLRRVAQVGVFGAFGGGTTWNYRCDNGCYKYSWWSVEPYLELRAFADSTVTPYGRVSVGLARLSIEEPGKLPVTGLAGHLELGLDLHQSPNGFSCRLMVAVGGIESLSVPIGAAGIQLGYVL